MMICVILHACNDSEKSKMAFVEEKKQTSHTFLFMEPRVEDCFKHSAGHVDMSQDLDKQA